MLLTCAYHNFFLNFTIQFIEFDAFFVVADRVFPYLVTFFLQKACKSSLFSHFVQEVLRLATPSAIIYHIWSYYDVWAKERGFSEPIIKLESLYKRPKI